MPYQEALQKIQEAKENHATELDLSGLGLENIPKEINELPLLEILKLSENNIREIQGLGQLAKLSELYLDQNKISEINGLDQLINLRRIDLDQNQLSEIQGLEQLTELTRIDLDQNQFSEIKGLDQLSKLNELYLSQNQISEIKGLDHLTELTILRLDQNQVSEIQGLEHLPKLSELYLGQNQISEIQGLGQLAKLSELYLSQNQISEIQGLEQLSELTLLALNGNKISEIKGLEQLVNLSILNLDQNQISEIQGLVQLTELTRIDLDQNQISEIKGLDHLPKLSALYLSQNQISGIQGLEQLTELTILRLDQNQISEIQGLEQLVNLSELYLYQNQLTEIQGLDQLVKLRELYLYQNQILEVQGLEQLTELTILRLDQNKLVEIKGLEQLIKLSELYLNQNQIAEIQGLEQLTELTKLSLSQNQITEIQGLEQLVKLRELYLYQNQLSEIKGLDQLTELTKLSLYQNHISEIKGVEKLIRLSELYLYQNQITEIKGLKQLINLSELYLNQNHITEIQGLEQLTELTKLSLNQNQLTEIKGLGQLTELTKIDLDQNQISEIKGLEPLSALTILNLDQNQISKIKGLDHLAKLTELGLNQNQLTEIQGLGQLTELTLLALGENQISEIQGLEQLNKLTKLGLNQNQLTEIQGLGQLTELMVLALGQNQLTEIKGLDQIVKLKELYLDQNQISEIKGLEQLTELTKLRLDQNLITEIKGLDHLVKLNELYLDQNKIKKIPLSLLDLNLELQWTTESIEAGIGIGENPVVIPPVDIVKQGNEAIRRYYREMDEKGQALLFEAKLILVGDGEVGKTTLLKKLQGDNAVPERTRGVDIVQYSFSDFDQTFNLNVWDFGGQDIYYAIHRFFLSENALYVLVTKTRLPEDNFDYWIPNIALFGGMSPILIVKNLYKDFQRDISIKRFLQSDHFKVINQIFEVNLLEGDIKQIENAIRYYTQSLPHIGQGVPKNWLLVREKLKELAPQSAYISFEKFENLCRNNGIEDQKTINDLAKYFHDLGISLWYHKVPALKDKVILQPEWVTNAVYRMVDDVDIQRQKGLFDENDINRLWGDKGYQELQDELLALMKAFRLCYQKRGKREYIIPALLLQDEPDELWKPDKCLQVQYEYLFMPRGIVNQLTAELHRNIKSDEGVWSRGVILTHDLAEARVVEDIFKRTITIESKGVNPSGLLGIIMHELDKINETYPGVEVKKWVPCICTYCQKQKEPDKFEYKVLIEKLKRGKETYFCNTGDEPINIRALLLNVGIQAPKGKGKLERGESVLKVGISSSEMKGGGIEEKKNRIIPDKEQRPIRIFFSYSKDDKPYRDELDRFLNPLKRRKDAISWHDREILPGQKWDKKIKEQLQSADIVLFLVSTSFLNTDYIMDTEVPLALERHSKKQAVIIPVIIRPCPWEEYGFSDTLALPEKGKAISAWSNRDDAYMAVFNGLKKTIQAVRKGTFFQ